MAIPLRVAFILILSLLCCVTGHVNAQVLSCEKLKEIVKIVGTDSTLNAIKGPEIESKYEKQYTALETLWDKENGMGGQYIIYDKDRHGYVYHAFNETEGTPGIGLVNETLKAYKDCLGAAWILKRGKSAFGDSVFYLKNPENFVVIMIKGLETKVTMDFYNDSKKGDECIYGDCDFYLGSKHFFSEDIYTGTFIDEALSGFGSLKWYADGTAYQGSFLDNQIEGYGSLLNNRNQVVQTGVFFKGNLVTVDTTQKTCQYGNCQAGFGLKVVPGGFYIGNFKDGVAEGLGELVMNKTTFYGYFVKNVINGRGIFINALGGYTFATYVNGRPTGNYEQDYTDKTSREADATDGSGSLFDENNILIKSGIWSQAGFTEYTDGAYLDAKAFAQSLKGLYSYRKTAYKEIRGEQSKRLQSMGIEFYKSKLLFLNAFDTNISTNRKYIFFITVDLSRKDMDKLKSVALYNKYYNSLNKGLGSRWKTTTDDGPASATKSAATVVLENLFDKSKTVTLSLDRGSVRMEIY